MARLSVGKSVVAGLVLSVAGVLLLGILLLYLAFRYGGPIT